MRPSFPRSATALAFLGLIQVQGSALAQAPQTLPQPLPVRAHLLAGTAWLAEHLKDPQVVVLHVADGFADYKRGHIPGARFLAASKFIDNSGAVGSELPPVEALAKVFSELGIGDRTRVVIYATNSKVHAARAWFTLDFLGHGDRACLLDGGVEAWLEEDRPVTGAVPAFTAAPFTPKPRSEARAGLAEVKQAVESGSAQVLDSRPARRFAAGHLAGARNLYWQETLESEDRPVLRSPEQLRALLAARGFVAGRKVVSYCEVGLQASHGYFLARYLGYEAAMYDGSYQEWTAKNLPVVKGEEKPAAPSK
jgi:thiosulfate/3-mercaptopyruvate sulfurtransferase